MDRLDIIYEYKGYNYRAIADWKKFGRATYWAIDHLYKTPEFRVDWMKAPFELTILGEEEFRFWIDMQAPEPRHLKVEMFTGAYMRRLMGVHEQLGIPLGEWEQLRLGLKMMQE